MKIVPSFYLVALVITTGISLVVMRCNADGDHQCDYLSVAGGGCPRNFLMCQQGCSSCYVGVGRIVADCGFVGGTSQPECRCYFVDGAPCPPKGVECPGRSSASFVTNQIDRRPGQN